MTDAQKLHELIVSRRAQVVVIGGGYVGRPLASACTRAGFTTSIYDTDPAKVEELLAAGLTASSTPAALNEAHIVVVCVPTPLSKTKDPDTRDVEAAIEKIGERFACPRLVILESTVSPGFTRSLVDELQVGDFLAFSPERTDPGNEKFHIHNTPKIVAGVSDASAQLAELFYATFVDTVVRVSSTDTAEMVKLLENTFRAVNIGLANEMAIMCRHLGLDVWEVIRAASTKPYGFMPFYPGPGVGGHCIPVDPLYLSWQLRTLQYDARFIQLADQVNSAMPAIVVDRVTEALNTQGKAVKGSRILLFGVAYKAGVSDVRESPALEIWERLEARGASVRYFDAHVPAVAVTGQAREHNSPWWGSEFYSNVDCAVIVTAHPGVFNEEIVQSVPVTVDCRNATAAFRHKYPGKVVML